MDLVSKVTCNHIVGNPEVAYTLASCPRCLGTGTYGGFVIGKDGKISIVTSGSQLSQRIQKALTERRRPSGYGFDYSLLNSGVIDINTVPAIRNELTRCVSYLKFLTDKEISYGVRFTPTERIREIRYINVFVDESDPRGLIADIVVTTEAFTEEVTTVALRR